MKGRSRVAGRSPWRTLCVGVSALIVLLWLAVAFTSICSWISTALARRDPIAPADAVYVLTSNARNGELNGAAISRLSRGLELVRDGWAPRLAISDLPGRKRGYAAAAERFARARGFDGELVVTGRASNTREEALALAESCRELGWKRVLLVTSPLHARRAAAVFEHAGLEVLSSPAAEVEFDERLDRAADRLAAFGKIAYEVLALSFYWLRGWV